MNARHRLVERRNRLRSFYCVDTDTGKRVSLATSDRDAAEQIVLAKNQALRQPALNLSIAKAYLVGSDSGVAARTWEAALDTIVDSKAAATQLRWRRAAADRALDPLRNVIIIGTRAQHLLNVVKKDMVSTNVYGTRS